MTLPVPSPDPQDPPRWSAPGHEDCGPECQAKLIADALSAFPPDPPEEN